MFFWLSKTFDIVCSPPLITLVLAASAALCARRGRALCAWGFGVAACLVLYTLSSALVSDALVGAVEQNGGQPYRPDVRYDAVIVLGGFIGRDLDTRFGLSEPADRLLRGFEILRAGRARFAILSGGGLGDEVESDQMAMTLEAWGIAGDRLIRERTSINTRGNALGVAQIIEQRGLKKVLLITSAFHMQRALECFRALGIEPDVLPCDYMAFGAGNLFEQLAPRATILAISELMLHELLGRTVYRVMGYAKG